MTRNCHLHVIPLSRATKRPISNLAVACKCVMKKSKKELGYRVIRLVLTELILSRSFNVNYELTLIKKIIFFCQVIIKRPALIMGAFFFSQTYFLVKATDCGEHSLLVDKKDAVWYSASAAMEGLPWAYDVFSNSLAVVRNRDIQILVFGSGNLKKNTKNGLKIQEPGTMDMTVETLVLPLDETDVQLNEILTWKNTKLLELDNAEIIHGSVLSKNNKVFTQDIDASFHLLPSHMTPNSLWYVASNSERYLLNTPSSTPEALEIDSCVFINSSTDNFYHFMSESIRVLIMARQANIDVSNIVIRSKLPRQFYEIIREIFPVAVIVKMDKGKKIRANKVIFAQYKNRLSLEKSLFREMPLSVIQDSDEWKTWSWLRSEFLLDSNPYFHLYLPRSHFQSRGIFNSKSLERKLRKEKFEIFDTEFSSFAMQRNKFNNAKIICCTTGASLLNMIFMPRGSTVLEISYPSKDSWKFLANLCELKYYNLPIRSFLPEAAIESLDVYIAPVYKILNKIRELTK